MTAFSVEIPFRKGVMAHMFWQCLCAPVDHQTVCRVITCWRTLLAPVRVSPWHVSTQLAQWPEQQRRMCRVHCALHEIHAPRVLILIPGRQPKLGSSCSVTQISRSASRSQVPQVWGKTKHTWGTFECGWPRAYLRPTLRATVWARMFGMTVKHHALSQSPCPCASLPRREAPTQRSWVCVWANCCDRCASRWRVSCWAPLGRVPPLA